MKPEDVRKAWLLAEEFCERAEAVIEENKGNHHWVLPSMKSGALRRQSMELTRALARMRKA